MGRRAPAFASAVLGAAVLACAPVATPGPTATPSTAPSPLAFPRTNGEVVAGRVASGALGPGQAYRILTGAPPPPGSDAVVHLAAVSGPDADEVRDVNIGGTRAIADAATRAGVRKLVYASSHSVYGAHPDNDFPLTESSPLRP